VLPYAPKSLISKTTRQTRLNRGLLSRVGEAAQNDGPRHDVRTPSTVALKCGYWSRLKVQKVEHEARPSSAEFGTLLRRYRIAAGLSQEELADRARMSANGIGALERGYRRTPQRETLRLLADALELDAEQRKEFEAAATRSGAPIRRDESSVTRRVVRDSIAPNLSLAHVQIGPFQASLSRPARPITAALILALAVSIMGGFVMSHSTNSAGARPSQVVTTLGPFEFDVSPYVESKTTVTPIGTLPANAAFTATEGQTIEVACNEGTRYRRGRIRRLSGPPPTPLPLRYKLIVDGKRFDTYTVGTKFLLDFGKLGTARASHALEVDPLDTVPNSTMTFSCVTIVSY
jgi:transcriptional regulator with XRE-family HTH domain